MQHDENADEEKIEVIDLDDFESETQPSSTTVIVEQKAAVQKETPKNKTDWEDYEKFEQTTEYIESEYDHKAWLLKTNFKDVDVIKLHDLVQKELALSYLPDHELALIYAIKMDCIEEWLSMGFKSMAKRGLVHMLFRLRLNTSIEGIEAILQHGTSSVSITGEKEGAERETAPTEPQEQKPKLGLSKLIGRIRGGRK